MRMMVVALLLLVAVSVSSEPIFLPYSQTEDVDFTIHAPDHVGCYRWSTDNEEIVELDPLNKDYTLHCGTQLDIKIIPGTASSSGPTKLEITGEDVRRVASESLRPDLKFEVVVTPVHRLNIVGVTTHLKVAEEPVAFGLAAFDQEGHEFDTLDGVQIAWFIGSQKDIAEIKDTRSGPVVHVRGLRSGKGTLICLLSDPNYQDLDVATMEFTVTAELMLEPDGVYLLQGGEANITLYERIGTREEPILKDMHIWDNEKREVIVTTKNETIVSVDQTRGVVVGRTAGEETTLLVKDLEGNILKGVPVRVSRPHSVEVTCLHHPNSNQLMVNREYDIAVNIYDKNKRSIFPSDNILVKTTFAKQFQVIQISKNGLRAKVRTLSVGIGKIRANLRSTLAPDQQETELAPLVKGVTDFEIYEEILVTPNLTFLPWDSLHPDKMDYRLTYRVTGGGKVYKYQVDRQDLAEVSSAGQVRILSGPGLVTYTASMAASPYNNHSAQIYLLEPVTVDFTNSSSETVVGQELRVGIAAATVHPDTGERVVFNDCNDLSFDFRLSNAKDFKIAGQSKRGDSMEPGACAILFLKPTRAGATTVLTLSYLLVNGTEIRTTKSLASFEGLVSVDPPATQDGNTQVVLPVGASRKVIFKGGPMPWIGKPSKFYKEVSVDSGEIASAVLRSDLEEDNFSVVQVTCLALGLTKAYLVRGNKASKTNRRPNVQKKFIEIVCSEPARITQLQAVTSQVGGSAHKRGLVNPDTARVVLYTYRDIALSFVVKDSEGRKLDNLTSLAVRVLISEEKLLTCGQPCSGLGPDRVSDLLPLVSLPASPLQLLHPQGSRGDVDVQVAITGYRPEVLASVGARMPRALPPPPPPDWDQEEDDAEERGEDTWGPADTIQLTLDTDAGVEKIGENEES